MIRPPAVAGRFYPGQRDVLSATVDSLISGSAHDVEKAHALACMVPHAGYVYSGRVAAEVYRRIEIPKRVILVGPRHFPRGASLAILSEGSWQTPLGTVPIDSELASRIVQNCPLLREDSLAHSSEHSLEVQLPFLQRLAPELRFVPIVLGTAQWEQLEELGHALAQGIQYGAEPVLLIASSDMNHYETDAITRVKDRKAIDRMLALDPRALFDVVRNEQISMCGYAAAAAVLIAARDLGASNAELVNYATSGEVNGDMDEVVGYAGVVIA
jgi:AmmeMemoRadiSam system protein B